MLEGEIRNNTLACVIHFAACKYAYGPSCGDEWSRRLLVVVSASISSSAHRDFYNHEAILPKTKVT